MNKRLTLKSLANISPAASSLSVYGNFPDFDQLSRLSNIEELKVFSLSRKNSAHLSSLIRLKHLFLRWGGFTDLSFLHPLRKLNSLVIWQTSGLKSLDGIEALENLQSLTLFEAASTIRSLSLEPLRALKKLVYLQLRGPMNIDSLSPLSYLHPLERLDLFTTIQDGSLAPLRDIPKLVELDMWMLEKRYSLEELSIAAALAPKLLEKWLDFPAYGMDCKKCGTTKKALIGRGTRSFCPVCQPARGEEFAAAFKEMVKRRLEA